MKTGDQGLNRFQPQNVKVIYVDIYDRKTF